MFVNSLRSSLVLAALLSPLVAYGQDNQILTTCDSKNAFTEQDGQKEYRTASLKALSVIAQNANFRLDVLEHIPLKRCLKLIESGKIDVKAGLIFSKERQRQFFMLPYAKRVQSYLYKHKDNTISNFSDYPDVKIGAVAHYKIPESFSQYSPNIIRMNDLETAFDLLLQGKIDAFLGSEAYFDSIENKAKFTNQFIALKQDGEVSGNYYIAINQTNRGRIIRKRLESSIEKLKQNNQIQGFYESSQ